jgi:hypothetical protein
MTMITSFIHTKANFPIGYFKTVWMRPSKLPRALRLYRSGFPIYYFEIFPIPTSHFMRETPTLFQVLHLIYERDPGMTPRHGPPRCPTPYPMREIPKLRNFSKSHLGWPLRKNFPKNAISMESVTTVDEKETREANQ